MYYRFGKFFFYFSIFGFILFLLYFYSAMPELLKYEPDAIQENTRDSFFYSMIGLFAVVNVIVLLPPKMLETKSYRAMHRVFPVGDDYRDYILAWFYSFAGVINFSLLMMVFYVHAINNQNEIQASKFNFFFYLIPVLLAGWLFALFVLLFNKFKQVRLDS